MNQALTSALLHFVWQGAVVAFLLWMALGLLRNRSANARYVVSCAALALMAVLPLITAWVVYQRPVIAAATEILAAVPAAATAAAPRIDQVSASGVVRRSGVVLAQTAVGMRTGCRNPQTRGASRSAASRDGGRCCRAHAIESSGARADLTHRGRAERDRMDSPRDPALSRDRSRPDARTVGSRARARAGAHPPPRLSDQHHPDAGGDGSFLPSRGVVDLGAHPPRARAVLRRCSGRLLRRRAVLRPRADHAREIANHDAPFGG